MLKQQACVRPTGHVAFVVSVQSPVRAVAVTEIVWQFCKIGVRPGSNDAERNRGKVDVFLTLCGCYDELSCTCCLGLGFESHSAARARARACVCVCVCVCVMNIVIPGFCRSFFLSILLFCWHVFYFIAFLILLFRSGFRFVFSTLCCLLYVRVLEHVCVCVYIALLWEGAQRYGITGNFIAWDEYYKPGARVNVDLICCFYPRSIITVWNNYFNKSLFCTDTKGV
jgi:hypothetical protein